MNKYEMLDTDKKDHYILKINDVNIIGVQERSEFRHLIEVMDNKINVGL